LPGITEKAIAAARSGDRERILWDGDGGLPGFGVRILPGGVKTFFLQYRIGRKNRRQKLGRWIDGAQSQVEKMRRRARAALAEIDKGVDPVERERQQRDARKAAQTNTLTRQAARFLFHTYGPSTRPRAKSTKEMRRLWRTAIVPTLGRRPVSEIRRGEIIGLLDKLEADARNPERGWNGATTANRVLARLRTFFRWALERELVSGDPTAGIRKRKGERKRSGEVVLEDWELRWIMAAADTLPYPTGPFLKLALLSGQRPEAETMRIRRSQLDHVERLWKLPPQHYKTDEYFELPFSNAAWEVVKGLEPYVTELEKRCAERIGQPLHFDHLLVSATKCHGDIPIQDASGIKAKIDAKVRELQDAARKRGEAVKPLRPWTLYALRHTMKTKMQKLGVGELVSELCLGHVPPGMQGRYGHHAFREEKRAAFERWAAHLAGIVNPASNVVVLPVGWRTPIEKPS